MGSDIDNARRRSLQYRLNACAAERDALATSLEQTQLHAAELTEANDVLDAQLAMVTNGPQAEDGECPNCTTMRAEVARLTTLWHEYRTKGWTKGWEQRIEKAVANEGGRDG